ncbi:MAG: hypothetical protein FWD69_03560 [Polyangiaceae bacterium]|nr:hypothetical protein [Polyangiaceae bacterium]
MNQRTRRRITQACATAFAASIAGWILSACVGQDTPLISAAPDNGDASLGADAGTTCTASMPFVNVVEVGGVNTPDNEFAPTLMSDEKTIVFARIADSFSSLYIATRASINADFETPQRIAELSGTWDDVDPWLSASGNEILFVSDRSDSSDKIYRTQRNQGVFGAPTLLLPDWLGDSHRPSMTSDGSELFFSSTNASNIGKTQIFHSLNSGNGFPEPELVQELMPSDPNAYSNDGPVLSRDGLTMYFASDRTSIMHIYRTERASPGNPFNNVPVLISTSSDTDNEISDAPGWLSDDGCRLYFDRKQGGLLDIFVASKL